MANAASIDESGTFSVSVPIAKELLDEERRHAFGWSSVITDERGQLTFDYQGTQIPIAELEHAAYEYVKTARGVGDQHERVGVGKLIASIVMTPTIRKAMGLPPDGRIGWFVGFEVQDEGVWKRIKSGELAELSIGGSAVKEWLE